MRNVCLPVLCGLAMMLTACGSGSSNPINGNWSATLTNTGGATVLGFTATLSENSSSGAVSVSNLSFTTSNSCFSSGTTAIATFTSTGTVSGVTTGTFQMTVQSGTSNANGTNQLTMQGTLNNTANSNIITGNWNLTGTGSGCTGSGNFTMGLT